MSYEKVTQVQTRLVIGVKQTIRALKNEKISEVLIAGDADQSMTANVVELATTLDVPIHWVDSRKKLGKACGIDVSATAVAIRHT